MNDSFDDRLWILRQRFQTRAASDAVALNELSARLEQSSSPRRQIQQISHSLAGAGSTFGFADVSVRAAELGNLIINSAGHSDLASACQALIFEIKRISESIEQRPGLSGEATLQQPLSARAQGASSDTEISQAGLDVQAGNVVGVFAAGRDFAPLAAAITNLGYVAVDISCSSAAEHLTSTGKAVAAVIGNDVEGWAKIALQLSTEIPVLLIGEDLDFQDRLAAARAGVSGVLSKPVDVFDLADWLDELTSRNKETAFSILLIEDDEILAETYSLALTRAGMRTEIATDISTVLDRIQASAPDLILLDIQLPGVNGVEVARIIRQSRRDLWLPIVFLSGESDRALQMEARKYGGDDFIAKPVNPEDLVSLVRLRANRAAGLRSLMERDSLTGLLNHARLKDRLFNELERCRRTGTQVSLAMVDLDHFKQVNDIHGHMNGDRVIRTLAHTLTGALRRIDIVGRYGGEEFGVILLDSSPEAAMAVMDRIRKTFSKTAFGKTGETFNVTLSVGVAGSRIYPTAELLIAAADRALYAAKAGGRNRAAMA
jgi:diguanylate cyclase (GGDEF)-like protein